MLYAKYYTLNVMRILGWFNKIYVLEINKNEKNEYNYNY